MQECPDHGALVWNLISRLFVCFKSIVLNTTLLFLGRKQKLETSPRWLKRGEDTFNVTKVGNMHRPPSQKAEAFLYLEYYLISKSFHGMRKYDLMGYSKL